MLTTYKRFVSLQSAFRAGAIILIFVLLMVVLSFFSPYEPDEMRVVPTNKPPSVGIHSGNHCQPGRMSSGC